MNSRSLQMRAVPALKHYGFLVRGVMDAHLQHPEWPASKIASILKVSPESVHAVAKRKGISLASGHACNRADCSRPTRVNLIRDFLAEHPCATAREIALQLGKKTTDINKVARENCIELRRMSRDERVAAQRVGWGKDPKRTVNENRRDAMREARKSNPEIFRAHSEKRRARKQNAEGHFTADDLRLILERQRCKCAHAWCRRSLRKSRHIDHIQPLAKGGSNWPSNLQFLCPPCNLKKGSVDPIDFARRIGMLL